MADGSNGQRLFRPVSNDQQWTFETSDVIWSQESTLVYTLNPELIHRSTVIDVQMYEVTIYPGFAFIPTVFEIFKNYPVNHQI